MKDKMNISKTESNKLKILKKKKNKKAFKAKEVINDSGGKKLKKSKLKKLKAKELSQKPQETSDDNESDIEICEFSDGEETDEGELKNDVEKFIQSLHFDKLSESFYSDEESDNGNVPQSPKKKKLKSSKVQTEMEISDKRNKNTNKNIKQSNDSTQSKVNEQCEGDNENECTEQKSKKSKKNKNKGKNIADNEKNADSESESSSANKIELNIKEQQQGKKNKKNMLKSDSNENINMKNKKDKTLPIESSSKIPKKQNNNAEEKKNEIMEKLKKQLQSASFRLINEQLYTSSGSDAHQMFKEDPNSFKVYHEGYSQQVTEWPVKPLDLIISWLRKKPNNWTVADFGCGKAILSKSIKQKVHSLDLIKSTPNVIECNMAHTPLESNSVNVVVFCLSLMGTNLTEFIVEANRVLVDGGVLKIAEIESRFENNVNQFLRVMSILGFRNIHKNQKQKYFWLFDFIKIKSVKLKSKLPELKLKPCIYKKR